MNAALKAVVFDWAGTMIDFGSRAPVVALCKLFEAAGVPLTEAEARADMGMAKSDHIASILVRPRVRDAWTAVHGQAPSAVDVERLFADIGPMMREAARECAELIPGAADVAARLRAAGVKIGSCTGYTRPMMADILPLAEAQGYKPDMLVCAGDTAAGRPSPLMLWKNLVELGAVAKGERERRSAEHQRARADVNSARSAMTNLEQKLLRLGTSRDISPASAQVRWGLRGSQS